MKFIKNLMLGAFAAALATSCSSDPKDGPNPGTDPENGDGVYMGLTIKMPGDGSRSETTDDGQSNDGNEVGTNEENAVKSVLIVLAKSTDNSFIVCGEVLSDKLKPIPAQNSYSTVSKIDKTKLNTYYTSGSFSREVNVFVFCNPTTDLREKLTTANLGDKTWYDLTCTVKEGIGVTSENTSIWGANSFLMSNHSIATRQLPASMEDWNNYKTEADAFDLSGLNSGGQSNEVDNSATKGRGAIDVQRVAARFDFKDGSLLGDNTYDVVKTIDAGNIEQTLVQIQLGSMALTNMANEFYYLPRVSNNGQLAGSTLCGKENNTNYMVGPFAAIFNRPLTTGFSIYFNFPFFNDKGEEDNSNWQQYEIAKVLEGNKDNWQSQGYRVWRYATENVIPADPENQTMGVSTIIVFKGKMLPSDWAKKQTDETIKDLATALTSATGDPDKDPILYSFNKTLYVTWPNVQKAAIAASVKMENNVPVLDANGKLTINRADPLYVAVYGNGGMGTFTWGTTPYTDELAEDNASANHAWVTWNGNKNRDNLAAMRKAVTGVGFTIYQSSNDKFGGSGYYCYYYYKNRHNDNNQAGVMGPMEFSVVRNNVYKLAVTKISELGHPRTPENDPNKPKPEEPDEKDEIYITVTCRVLPWVVRVNNIIF